jgi:hypothetical protein
MKSFSKWTIEDVEETFQLVLQKNHEQLTAWMIPHHKIGIPHSHAERHCH